MEDRVEHESPAAVNGLVVAKYEAPRALFLAGIPKLQAELAAVDVMAEGAELVVGDISGRVHQAKAKANALKAREGAPALAAVETVKGWWRPITEGLEVLAAEAKRKASDALYHKRRREEEARKRAEAVLEEARRAEATLAAIARAKNDKEAREAYERSLASLRGARVAVDALAPPGAPTGIKTDHGTMSPMAYWTWEVEDEAEVPREWLTLDRGKITAAVKAKDGVREIRGLRIWQAETLAQR